MAVTNYMTFNGVIVHENRNGDRRDYIPDTLGSTAALVDHTESVTDESEYWPYGEVAQRTGTSPTPFTFIGTLGYYTDSPMHVYVRARHYMSGKARWLTVDPLWPFQVAYNYAAASPVSRVDPTGMLACDLPCPKNCQDILGIANGITYCCEGVAVICTSNKIPDPIRKCVQAHEREHQKRLDCEGKPNSWSPADPAGECLGYTAEFRCCITTPCGGSPACEKWKTFCLCKSALRAADEFCNKPGSTLDPAITAFLEKNRYACAILVDRGNPK